MKTKLIILCLLSILLSSNAFQTKTFEVRVQGRFSGCTKTETFVINARSRGEAIRIAESSMMARTIVRAQNAKEIR